MASAMMLDFLGEEQAAACIEAAAQKAITKDLPSLEAGKMGRGTREVGDLVCRYVLEQ
jgi:3-isopropylmalate dehydrogenase